MIVDVNEDAGTATASAYVTIFQALPDFPLQPIFSGRYSDRLTRIDGTRDRTERRVINDLYGDISRHVRYAPKHGGPPPAGDPGNPALRRPDGR